MGHRWGWVQDVRTRIEYVVHDRAHITHPSTDTNVVELVPGIRHTPAGRWLTSNQLVVFELRKSPITAHYRRSVSGWTQYEVYLAAMMQSIRERCPYKHQAAVNRLVKLLLKRAIGEEVKIRQINAQFNELLRLECPAGLLADLELLFLSSATTEEINNPELVILAPL